MKIIPFHETISMNSYRLLQEININRALNHPNVIKFIKYFVGERPNSDRRNAILVFELGRESLDDYIQRNVFYLKEETHVATILHMLAKGLQYIHEMGFQAQQCHYIDCWNTKDRRLWSLYTSS